MFEGPQSYDFFSVGGASCANGFDLEYSTAIGQHKEFRFRVPGTTEARSRRFDWVTAAIFMVMLIVSIKVRLYWPKVFCIYLLYRSVGPILERSYKGWHWVEHQAALWLEGDLEQRFEDINPISTRCGSTYVVAEALLLASIGMVTLDYGPWALPAFASAFATVIAFIRRKRIPLLRPWLRFTLLAWATPATMVCLGFQRLLFMRRPTKRQLRWAKRWAVHVAPHIADSLMEDSPPHIVKIISPRQL